MHIKIVYIEMEWNYLLLSLLLWNALFLSPYHTTSISTLNCCDSYNLCTCYLGYLLVYYPMALDALYQVTQPIILWLVLIHIGAYDIYNMVCMTQPCTAPLFNKSVCDMEAVLLI